MPVLSCDFDKKAETALLRACSLSKDRSQFEKRSSSSDGRKKSAAPSGSDFAVPHRAARAAKRTRLAKGAIATSSDMPQISMGRTGHWVRWLRKPSIARMGDFAIEEVDVDETHIHDTQYYDTTVASPGYVSDFATSFDMDLNDQTLFPALASAEAGSTEKIPAGAWTTKSERESVLQEKPSSSMPEEFLEEKIASLTPEESAQCSAVSQCLDLGLEGKSGMDDWIFVASDDAGTASPPPTSEAESFDVLRSRDSLLVTNLTTPKRKPDLPEEASGIDWSVPGIPKELLKKLVRSITHVSRHSSLSEENVAPVPLRVMRAQNVGSSRRQRSTPKSPRSHSKPHTMRQARTGR
mmetsp:Transcript_106860/g.168868  ORF Transcript_106860/g.168868 Transcript_106860/m.168868 type:complete len:352 (-) Transcript_106860:323-1378(-)